MNQGNGAARYGCVDVDGCCQRRSWIAEATNAEGDECARGKCAGDEREQKVVGGKGESDCACRSRVGGGGVHGCRCVRNIHLLKVWGLEDERTGEGHLVHFLE